MARTTRNDRKRAEVEAFLVRKGWTKDRHGHFKKERDDGTPLRMKFSKLGVRYERQVTLAGVYGLSERKEWVRVQSAYFKDLHVTPDDKLAGWKSH